MIDIKSQDTLYLKESSIPTVEIWECAAGWTLPSLTLNVNDLFLKVQRKAALRNIKYRMIINDVSDTY
jgi:hypothetical protein